MAYQKKHPSPFFLLLVLAFICFSNANGHGLKLGFYKKTCPSALAIAQKITAAKVSLAPSLAAALLRLHFHDCFVQGCDGSVLISSKTKHAEKDGLPNLSLRGYQVIDAIKTAVEHICPGVVSCADILALAARDAVYQIKGPYWPVPLGRRDGRISLDTESLKLPRFTANITELKNNFADRGLSVKDLVVLSGAHTVGISHCSTVVKRLYNFTDKGDTDPSLDSEYAVKLKSKCKPTDTTKLLEMDPGSYKTFDENYYTNVLKRRGLFESDAALLNDYETSAYVKLQAQSHGSTFFKDFKESMVNMGKIGVLVGSAGEIRRQCDMIN